MKIEPSALLWIASGAPWRWARLRDDGSPAHYIHSRFQRHDWRRNGRVAHLGRCAGFVVGMPVVLGLVAVCTARSGARVRREGGKGLLRQAREQVGLWLQQGILPLSYYIFDLHRGDAPTAALDYLYRYETKQGIYPILRATFSSEETTEALRNKALFAQRCSAHGVPAVTALFTVEAGRLMRLDSDEPGLPRRDLFLKPLSGSGGRGAAVWTYAGEGRYRNADAGVKSEAELIAHLATLSQQQGAYVGRLYVRNHPLLEEISPGALSSVRVVTCLDEAGQPEVTHAVLRMARTPGTVVDNFHAGGIAASVALDSGVVGRATDTGLQPPHAVVYDPPDEWRGDPRPPAADVGTGPRRRPPGPRGLRRSGGGGMGRRGAGRRAAVDRGQQGARPRHRAANQRRAGRQLAPGDADRAPSPARPGRGASPTATRAGCLETASAGMHG